MRFVVAIGWYFANLSNIGTAGCNGSKDRVFTVEMRWAIRIVVRSAITPRNSVRMASSVRVSTLDITVRSQLAFDVARVSGCDQQVACSNAEVEITGCRCTCGPETLGVFLARAPYRAAGRRICAERGRYVQYWTSTCASWKFWKSSTGVHVYPITRIDGTPWCYG